MTNKQSDKKEIKTKDKSKPSKIKYYDNATVTCACGNIFHTGSTKQEIKVEICSMCHPFYTGNQKLVDTAGRVDKFRERMAKAESMKKYKSN